MKQKLSIAFIAIMLALFIAACGSNNNEDENLPNVGIDQLTQQHFLYDLDYMLYVLENNFALFDVAYWARGVDIAAIVENTRAEILANPEIDALGFYVALTMNFLPLQGVAHFGIINPHFYTRLLDGSANSYVASWPGEARRRLVHPRTLEFYRYLTYRDDELDSIFETMAIHVLETQFQAMYNNIVALREVELAQEFAQAIAGGNIDNIMPLWFRVLEIIRNTPNVVTDIIEDGRVAYLSVRSFMQMQSLPLWQSQKNQIFDFYYEIQGFEHLIIDLRSNGGGEPDFALDILLGALLEESVMVDGYAFVVLGEYSDEFATNLMGREREFLGLRSVDSSLTNINEMLEEFYLPQFRIEDAERLQYGFRTQTTIPAVHVPNFNGQPAFDGKVWLLTDGNMGSMAQISAWLFKEAEIATLVGDITGGHFGGPRTIVALPNTGLLFQMDVFYVTDAHGRPLEAGTIPHYFNRSGMCALQTVLALIDEQF